MPSGPVTTSRRGSFWVGIEPVAGPARHGHARSDVRGMGGAGDPRPGPPWVLVHGGGGQAIDYTTTFDGRRGWSRLLVEQGHTVFVVDRPGHGRSPHHPDILGPMGPQLGFEFLRPIFVPPPEGPDRTRRPTCTRNGRAGVSPAIRSTTSVCAHPGRCWPTPARCTRSRPRVWPSCSTSSDPAIVVTHSAGGPGTFAGADARPDKVAALFAIETLGPPFLKRPEMGMDLAWGLACSPITYDPAVTDPSELDTVTEERAELGPIPITLQREPARRLANLSRFPIAVVTAEASMFLGFDRHLVEFLAQGWVRRRAGAAGRPRRPRERPHDHVRAQQRRDARGAHRLGGAQALASVSERLSQARAAGRGEHDLVLGGDVRPEHRRVAEAALEP